jgi:aspartate aminotransferase
MRINARIAERFKHVQPSTTLAITSKAKKLKAEGKDIVNWAAGEPDFDTPDFIKAAAVQALKDGFTKYTSTTGIPELKTAIRQKFKADNELDYPESQIVVSCGAKHSIFNALCALVDPGDEVLIPSPYWVSYPEMVYLVSGVPRFIKTTLDNSFKVTAQELKKHISPRTKVFILNSPSNPTGCVYTRREIEEFAALCVQEKIFVISDEIYEKLIYDSCEHVSIASLGEEIRDLTVTVNGMSKSYSMTGWRIGYLAGPRDVVEAIGKLQDHSTSNPTSISQKAALAALSDAAFVTTLKKEFAGRRDYCVSRLKNMKGITFCNPQGAFYIFMNIAKTRLTSQAFAERFLDESYVALIPGNAFGMDTCVRMSFATGLTQLEKGMNRLEEFMRKL